MRAPLAAIAALIVLLLSAWPAVLPASETIPVSEEFSAPLPPLPSSGSAVAPQPPHPEPLHPSPGRPLNQRQDAAESAAAPQGQGQPHPRASVTASRNPETQMTGLLALLKPRQQDLDRAFLEQIDPSAYRITRPRSLRASEF
ncbi:MAG: hypothetical protein AB1473_24095 [Thermodesulfobacteriota bacterium]